MSENAISGSGVLNWRPHFAWGKNDIFENFHIRFHFWCWRVVSSCYDCKTWYRTKNSGYLARARARAPGPRMRGTSGPYPIRGLIICLPARAVVLAAFKMLIWRRPFNWYAAKTHVSVVKCKFEVKPANVLFNFPSWDRDWKLRPHKKALPYCGTAKNRSNYRASCDAKS